MKKFFKTIWSGVLTFFKSLVVLLLFIGLIFVVIRILGSKNPNKLKALSIVFKKPKGKEKEEKEGEVKEMHKKVGGFLSGMAGNVKESEEFLKTI